MKPRQLGPFSVNPIGLGCMNLSHAYGHPPERSHAIRLLNEALDMGYNLMDTAAMYGFGHNESLLGEAIMHRRDEFTLASKCGLFKDANGQRAIDGRPAVLRQTCEDALVRLGTETIDLYYLHRWDKRIPIEDSVGLLADLVEEGKIRSIGLSEVGADTIRRAHSVHPITAVQNEYSLWSRESDIAVKDATQDLGIALVAFSPLGRGYLADRYRSLSELVASDFRHGLPRFQAQHWEQNRPLLEHYTALCAEFGATPAQVALAWCLRQAEHIITIPGTQSIEHLRDNWNAQSLELTAEQWSLVDDLINNDTISGRRYTDAGMDEVDTEQF